MSDLALVLNRTDSTFTELPFAETPSWRDVLAAFAAGTVPHSWAVRAPAQWHGVLLDVMSRLYLCDNGRGDDGCGCEGCRSWRRDEKGLFRHPDLMVVGEFDKAANVEACRELIKELHLKPAAAKRRLGVVMAADRLLVHAANSLLKIAEEPPSHSNLFFLMEGGDFLPTLRSRSRFTTLTAPLSFESRPMPRGEDEWLEWLKNMKDDEDVPGLLSSWVSYFLQAGKREFAARVERLRLLVLQKKLSQTMVCDLLILALKEDLPFEHILGGLR